MNADNSPILHKTVGFIRELLKRRGNQRLPSVRSLAVQIGASTVTVSRAIGLLREEGLIESVWGRGIFPSGKSPQRTLFEIDSEMVKPESKYHKVIAAFKQDVLNGRFPTNQPVPSKSQLSAMYGVSYPTVSKVLTSLLNEGVLKRNGARYYFFTNRGVHRRRVAVIAFGLGVEAVKIETERERNFYRALSAAAVEHAVDLEIICYNDYTQTPGFFVPHGHTLESYIKANRICGIVLSSYHMSDSAACLGKLIRTEIPVSVWIEDRSILQSVAKYGSRYKRLTFFDSSYSMLPGRDVGTYLQERGHREIAYISPFHGSPWSQNRLEGLKKCAPGARDFWKVHAFVLTEYSNDYMFMEKILEKSAFAKGFIPDPLTENVQPFMAGRINSIRYEYETLLRDDLIFTCCKPIIEQASSVPAITAWVCANDLVACMIMDYWDHCGVPFEKRPALVGFDNSFRSIERRISSYDFNTPGEVQSMLTHLLYPGSSLFSESKPAIRLSGNLIERRSSRNMIEKPTARV